MAPVPVFEGHLLYASIDRAINASKGLLAPKDTESGWGGWVWGSLARVYADWSPPEPQLFEEGNINEVGGWGQSTESLSAVDSWFGGDSWPSDEDTFTKTGPLVEFEDIGDGVVGDTSNPVPQVDWWDLPKASRPKNRMPLDYQKPSSVTGRPEVPEL